EGRSGSCRQVGTSMFDPENEHFAAAMRSFGLACMVIFITLTGMRDDPVAAAETGGLASFAFSLFMLMRRAGDAGSVSRAMRIIAGRARAEAADAPRLWFASWLAAMSAGFWTLALVIAHSA